MGVKGRRAWWFVVNPPRHNWDWPDLFREYVPGEPYYWSVGNATSQRCAREARRGDLVVGYTAGDGRKRVKALAVIEEGGVVSPEEEGYTVMLRPLMLLGAQVPLSEVKANPVLKRMEFAHRPRGSIFRLTDEEWSELRLLLLDANPELEGEI